MLDFVGFWCVDILGQMTMPKPTIGIDTTTCGTGANQLAVLVSLVSLTKAHWFNGLFTVLEPPTFQLR